VRSEREMWLGFQKSTPEVAPRVGSNSTRYATWSANSLTPPNMQTYYDEYEKERRLLKK